LIDPPVTPIVCASKGGARNCSSNTEVIELLAFGSKTHFNISQTLSIGELRECHAEKLIPTREISHSVITTISLDALTEFVLDHKLHQLREHHFSSMHATSLNR
jgi:hypothetical protein